MKTTILTLAALSLLPFAHTAQAAEFNEAQTKEINAAIEAYIKENPQIILDSLDAYRTKQMEEQQKAADAKAKELLDILKENPDRFPIAGNKKGDIVIAEFFDYNCGYCKKAFEGVQEAIADDKNVKFVFIDLPILGPSSTLASEYALAAAKQNKYWEFHQELMKFQGQKDEKNLTEMAEKVGIDVEKMKKDAAGDEVQKEIADNRKLAEDLNISGTPGFVIETQVIRGYVPYDQMKGIISGERQKKKEG
ncbi:MAG: DsbA family protein [Pseudobdellovibrionaceae bacterium]